MNRTREDRGNVQGTLLEAPHLQLVETETAVPNFVHVGSSPDALEAYVRLYLRDLTEEKADAIH